VHNHAREYGQFRKKQRESLRVRHNNNHQLCQIYASTFIVPIKKFSVLDSEDQEVTVLLFLDSNQIQPLLATFDEVVQMYGDDSIVIPDISSTFIFSEKSLFMPAVSVGS